MNKITCDSDHFSLVLKKMYEYYKDNKWCDIEIVINNHRYSLHKLVLVSNSDSFEDAMNSNNQQINVETEENFQREIVESLFQYFYTGNIIGLKLSNVEALFKLIKLLKCSKNIITYCYNFIESQINVQTVVEAHQLSERLCKNELVLKSQIFELNHFSEIIRTDNFVKLKYDQIHKLLESDNLRVLSEEVVFEGLKIWCMGDLENRKKQFCDLLRCIRLPILSRKFVVNEIIPFCEVCEVLLSEKIVKSIISWYILPDKRNLCTLNSKPRYSNYSLLAVFSSKILKYNFDNKCWEKHLDGNGITDHSGAPALLEDKLITADMEGVWSTSLLTGKTTRMRSMVQNRQDSAIAAFNNQLYVFGGFGQHEIIESVERWYPLNQSWKVVSSMDSERQLHAVVVHRDKIYVFGGSDENDDLNTAEVYDPINNDWENLPPMKVERAHCQAVSLGDHIYVIGSMTRPGTTCMERFNTVTKTWATMANVPEEMSLSRTVAYKDYLICFAVNHNWLYNPSINGWKIYKEIGTVKFPASLIWVPSVYVEKPALATEHNRN